MIGLSVASPIAAPCAENTRRIFAHRLVRLRHQPFEHGWLKPMESGLCGGGVPVSKRLVDCAPALMIASELTLGNVAQCCKKGLAGRLEHVGLPKTPIRARER